MKSGRIRVPVLAAAAVGYASMLGLATAAPLAAQEGGIWAEAAAGGGAMVPVGDLTVRRLSFGARLQSSAVASAGLSVWLPSGFGLALEGVYTRLDVGTTAGEDGSSVPGGLGEADYRAAVAELRYRYRYDGASSLVQPYWGLGAGLRRLDFQPIAGPDLRDATDFVFSGVIGSFVRISDRIGIRLELRDIRGSYDSGASDEPQTQNDLIIGLGAVLRLF